MDNKNTREKQKIELGGQKYKIITTYIIPGICVSAAVILGIIIILVHHK